MNVEPEEAEAIMDMMGDAKKDAPEVTERDFRKPRRLSHAQLRDVESALEAILPDVSTFLGRALGTSAELDLASVGESSAEHLFEEPGELLLTLRFRAAGQLGWILWENRPAVAALETVLGSPPDNAPNAEERPLSRIECKVIGGILASLAGKLTRVFGLECSEFHVAQTPEELGDWRDAGPLSDPHRLTLELAFQGPGKPSTILVCLPGFQVGAESTEESAPAELPEHLDVVAVDVVARMSGTQVPLEDLLALQEGDVIPIDARVGEPLEVSVEGQPFAKATLGTRMGHLALRIESFLSES